MTQIQTDSLYKIISTYGISPQIDMAIEECLELGKALLKYRRSESDKEKLQDSIIDEIADVSIMLEQLKTIYRCHAAVNDRVEYKINRQLKRIEQKGLK